MSYQQTQDGEKFFHGMQQELAQSSLGLLLNKMHESKGYYNLILMINFIITIFGLFFHIDRREISK